MGTPMAGVDADVWVTATPATALGGAEAMTDSGDHITYSAATHVYWDKSAGITIQNCATAAPVTTTCTGAITAGAGKIITPVTGTVMTNIVIGSTLQIAAGGGTAEAVVVTGITGSTFTANFAFAHNAGTAITTTWITVVDYLFQWATGRAVFTVARVVGVNNFTQILAGSWFASTQLDLAHDWQLSLKAAIVKTTAFQAANGWEDKTVTTKSGTGQIAAFRTDDRLTKELNNRLAFTLYASKTNNYRWQFFGYLTEVAPKSDVNSALEQTISFTVEDVAYFLIT